MIHLARWALYLDTGLMFGMPAAAMAVGGCQVLTRWRGLLIGAGLFCIPLSIFGFLLNLSVMADLSLGNLDRGLIITLLFGSALGLALTARCLAAAIYVLLMARNFTRSSLVLGGVTVITLAWSGHGGASEGALGYVRLIGDILHLLAASAWIGALALFLLALLNVDVLDAGVEARVGPLLSAFALPGSVIVGTLLITGFSNMWFIAQPADWSTIAQDSYGRAMLAKLALFLTMLGLATVNRFILVPRLLGQNQERRAVSIAKVTIAVEAAAGIVILALVAWLGTLDPTAT
ncbi:MAG: copper homeostasis membrane protein CopD [Sphingobium sp.]|nr:copper homeostasis membrane protein CopD [Sphingobium sp.]